jgi:hypothetical protein
MMMLLTDVTMADPPTVTPVLSGTYIAQIMHFCPASIANSTGPNSTGVFPTNSGDVNYNVFTVSFDPNAKLATVSGNSIDGSPLIVEGFPYTLMANNSNPQQTVPYSNSGTTFTVNTTTYNALFAKVDKKTGIPESVIFGGLEKGCATSGTFMQQ